MTLVNAALIGVFAALVAVGLHAPGPLVAILAAACGLAFFGTAAVLDVRRVQRMDLRYVSLFPTPAASDRQGDCSPGQLHRGAS